ncbi:MAG: hypothetical protein MJA29_01760 [Candidatus Omnitrophica bacterium]|nr:hypothetical protein [Candidatus Omnitrophota bacterium]
MSPAGFSTHSAGSALREQLRWGWAGTTPASSSTQSTRTSKNSAFSSIFRCNSQRKGSELFLLLVFAVLPLFADLSGRFSAFCAFRHLDVSTRDLSTNKGVDFF